MADGGVMGDQVVVDVPVEALRRRRASTVSIKRWGKRAMEAGRVQYPDVGQHAERPRTRAECPPPGEPCPWVSCKHHLYLDVNDRTGSVKINFPDLEVWELAEPCALDVADRGGITLEEVGALMNLTRERVRQLETRAVAQLAESTDLRSHAGLEDSPRYAPPVRVEPDDADAEEPSWATLRHVLALAGWVEDAQGTWRNARGRWMKTADAKAAALRMWRAA